MKTKITIPKIFKPLFLPNYTEEERKKFTPKYKADIKRRILKGETIDESEVGVKTFIQDGGRVSGKSKNGEYAATPDFYGEKGDIWYCRSEE